MAISADQRSKFGALNGYGDVSERVKNSRLWRKTKNKQVNKQMRQDFFYIFTNVKMSKTFNFLCITFSLVLQNVCLFQNLRLGMHIRCFFCPHCEHNTFDIFHFDNITACEDIRLKPNCFYCYICKICHFLATVYSTLICNLERKYYKICSYNNYFVEVYLLVETGEWYGTRTWCFVFKTLRGIFIPGRKIMVN